MCHNTDMGTPTDYENFWIVVATTAPVLAFANVFILTDWARSFAELQSVLPKVRQGVRDLSWGVAIPIAMVVVAFVFLATVFVDGLQSLTDGFSVLSPAIAALLEMLSFILTLAFGVLTGLVKLGTFRAQQRARRQAGHEGSPSAVKPS